MVFEYWTWLLWIIEHILISVSQLNIIPPCITDTVQLHFQRADGTVIQLFLDFQKEVQIYRLMILPEEELMVQVS